MSRGSRVRSPPGVLSACSVMVIIDASQALDPGSIPGRRTQCFFLLLCGFRKMSGSYVTRPVNVRPCSSVGRASD